ncbi:GNAT family protein [Luteococcus peritonei]|uniref:GNAT family protein n=1 Tax=Luteococcus peritonei TaxID=88874 RepID=A0ABW4RYM6_9ACTN
MSEVELVSFTPDEDEQWQAHGPAANAVLRETFGPHSPAVDADSLREALAGEANRRRLRRDSEAFVKQVDLPLAACPSTSEGYRIEVLSGEPDPSLFDDLRTLKQAMNSDIPRGEAGLPVQHWSDKRLRAAYRVRSGDRLWLALARDHQGRIAGFTELRNHDDADNRELLLQGDTLVLAEHRGHGLGRSLKIAAMTQACADAPWMVRAETSNDATNLPMARVNEELGFRSVCRVETWIREL